MVDYCENRGATLDGRANSGVGRSLQRRALAGAAIYVAALAWTHSAAAQQQSSRPNAFPEPSASGAAPQTSTVTERSAAQAGGGSATLGEIIVTATKRNERLRDVPESVTAISGAALAAVGPVINTGDLISSVPGARFNNLNSPLTSEISIRGSGTERGTGADSSVGLYSNGVYVGFNGGGGRNFTPIDSFDVDHVEVLEGPQGALYGRDAEYGVVNIISQRPTFKNSLLLDNVYTIETQQNLATVVANYAVNSNLAIRIGGEDYYQSSGFEYNPDTNRYFDTTSGFILRGQARYSAGRFDGDLLVQRQTLHIPSFYSADDYQPADPTTGYPGTSTYPKGFTQDLRSIPHNGRDYAKEDVTQVELFLNYNFGWANLNSSSSWRRVTTVQQVDQDTLDVAEEAALQTIGEKGAYPFVQNNNYGTTDTFYEDLHFVGAPFLGDRANWLAGLELLDQPQPQSQTTTQDPCATVTNPNPIIGRAACTGTPTQPQCVPILSGSTCGTPVSPYGIYNPTSSSYYSYAPYASLNFKLGAGFTLGGEVRYSHDHKSADNAAFELYTTTPYPFLTGGSFPAAHYNLDSGNTTYTATLSYKLPWRGDNLIYSKVGTGYRVGGFNFGVSPPLLPTPYPKGVSTAVNYAPVVPNYSDETSTSYEVGFKGTIVRRTYFTLAAYYQDTLNALAGVKDGCTVTNACLTSNTNYTVNGGTVHGSGLEAQFSTTQDILGGALNFQINGSTQTAHYASNPTVGVNGEKLNGLPLIGSSVAQNPHYLLDSTVNYVHPITDAINGFINVRLHGQWGGIQDSQTSAVVFSMDNFQDVDLRAGIDYRSLEFAVIARNLTDEFHRNLQLEQAGVNTVTGATVPVFTQVRPNLPTSVALEVKYRW